VATDSDGLRNGALDENAESFANLFHGPRSLSFDGENFFELIEHEVGDAEPRKLPMNMQPEAASRVIGQWEW
jgi:hypothetical protein